MGFSCLSTVCGAVVELRIGCRSTSVHLESPAWLTCVTELALQLLGILPRDRCTSRQAGGAGQLRHSSRYVPPTSSTEDWLLAPEVRNGPAAGRITAIMPSRRRCLRYLLMPVGWYTPGPGGQTVDRCSLWEIGVACRSSQDARSSSSLSSPWSCHWGWQTASRATLHGG